MSAITRAIDPDAYEWGLAEQLAAERNDSLHVLAWQQSGGKKNTYPKPIPRPGVTDGTRKFGSGPLTMEQMNEWLGNPFDRHN